MILIERIYEEYVTEDFDAEKASDNLIAYYHQSTTEQKKAIDKTLILICGWSMKSLLNFEVQGGNNDRK